ncbi:hypothetical protein [Oceanivirga salmonicida]|uniref:hypothetical protein n=1 Tax=Oceanivirga salmonicida TaxID=1769291 RepID=UPI0008370D3F|nr:hypothetical protein [Oceanivirga salmonicida]
MRFLEEVNLILDSMNEVEKNEFILLQAKLVKSNKRDAFLKVLKKEKEYLDIIEMDVIAEKVKLIKSKEIYLEYYEEYIEFNDYGYYGDFEIKYLDPFNIIDFLKRIIIDIYMLLSLGKKK